MAKKKSRRDPLRLDEGTVGNRVRIAREVNGLSQAALAREMKVTRAAVAQWESDTTTPSSDNLRKIALRLNCSYDWIATGRGDSQLTHALSKDLAQFGDDPFTVEFVFTSMRAAGLEEMLESLRGLKASAEKIGGVAGAQLLLGRHKLPF